MKSQCGSSTATATAKLKAYMAYDDKVSGKAPPPCWWSHAREGDDGEDAGAN